MKRILLCLAVLLSAATCYAQCGPGGCPTGPPFGNDSSLTLNLPAAAKLSACRVTNYEPSGRSRSERAVGSGTLIAKGDGWGAVISAGHVFSDGSESVKCQFFSGKEYDGKLLVNLLKSNSVDLALIELTSCPEEPVAPIATEAPKVGDMLAFSGFGSPSQEYRAIGGKLLRYTSGQRGGGPANQFYMSGGARQGDSGGPIFNLEGQLVGVLWGTDGAGTIGTYNGQIETFAACSDRYDFPWNRDNRAGRRAPDESMPLPPAPPFETPATPPTQVQPFDSSKLEAQLKLLEQRLAAVEKTTLTPSQVAEQVESEAASAFDVFKRELDSSSLSAEAKQLLTETVDSAKAELDGKVNDAKQLAQDAKTFAEGVPQKAVGLATEAAQAAAQEVADAAAESLVGRVDARIDAIRESIPMWVKIVLGVLVLYVLAATGWLAKLHAFNKRVLKAIPGERLDNLHARLDDNVERHTEAGWNPIAQGKAVVSGGKEVGGAAVDMAQVVREEVRSVLAAAGVTAALAKFGPGAVSAGKGLLGKVGQIDDVLVSLAHKLGIGDDEPEPPAPQPPAPPVEEPKE